MLVCIHESIKGKKKKKKTKEKKIQSAGPGFTSYEVKRLTYRCDFQHFAIA